MTIEDMLCKPITSMRWDFGLAVIGVLSGILLTVLWLSASRPYNFMAPSWLIFSLVSAHRAFKIHKTVNKSIQTEH
jgi:hypothetical protein